MKFTPQRAINVVTGFAILIFIAMWLKLAYDIAFNDKTTLNSLESALASPLAIAVATGSAAMVGVQVTGVRLRGATNNGLDSWLWGLFLAYPVTFIIVGLAWGSAGDSVPEEIPTLVKGGAGWLVAMAAAGYPAAAQVTQFQKDQGADTTEDHKPSS